MMKNLITCTERSEARTTVRRRPCAAPCVDVRKADYREQI